MVMLPAFNATCNQSNAKKLEETSVEKTVGSKDTARCVNGRAFVDHQHSINLLEPVDHASKSVPTGNGYRETSHLSIGNELSNAFLDRS